MQSLISIPTYQRAHQIGRAIEAALAQSQHDVTVVVIDDASTDDTQAACARWFGHPRFGYLRLGHNLGTAAAKNVALALLPFDAITFHDSDDIPHVDKLLRQQRTLSRTGLVAADCAPWHLAGGTQVADAPAQLDLVLTAHRFLSADGRAARIARTLSLVEDFFPNLQFSAGPPGDWVLINSGLFRRDLFARIGGYADSVEEDRDLRNRALMAGAHIWFIDDVLLDKYEQPDSLTAAGATGYSSARRRDDRSALWRTIADWRPGTAPAPVPIDLAELTIAFAAMPQPLAVATDIAMTGATRARLDTVVAALA
ncbi:glycosyltransferase family 2 protein [Sphingomonas sp. 4RDLI-65]|uniref:glycosyltransferase family 2 protein n=1 Tax=Sphingomonas sp. 4RDLI-65 TaxID=3111641 RepID=UPI003C27964B